MTDKIRNLFELVRAGLINFRDTDFSQVQYGSLGLALGAGLFIILFLVYKLLYGRNKFRRPYSGHRIEKKYQQGNLAGFLYLTPKLLFAVSGFFLLLGLAEPYLPQTKIEAKVESRERIDLVDISPSMGWPYENTDKCTGEVIRDYFLKFLKMRNGQNDRTSLWRFSAEPIMEEDFIIDDSTYEMMAEDMPYLVTDPRNPLLAENDPRNLNLHIVAPRDKVKMVYNGGGTNLVKALEAVTKHFDTRGSKKIKQRALLIQTDMAVDENPEKQLRELKKRNINIYLLYVKPNEVGEKLNNGDKKLTNAKDLKKGFEQYGVKFYDIQDRRSLDNAYRDIDKLEKSPVSLTRHLLRIFIYQRPLMLGIILLLFSVGLGLITEHFLGVSP